eukprot:764107-Hanusia_phi.AAC.2
MARRIEAEFDRLLQLQLQLDSAASAHEESEAADAAVSIDKAEADDVELAMMSRQHRSEEGERGDQEVAERLGSPGSNPVAQKWRQGETRGTDGEGKTVRAGEVSDGHECTRKE